MAGCFTKESPVIQEKEVERFAMRTLLPCPNLSSLTYQNTRYEGKQGNDA